MLLQDTYEMLFRDVGIAPCRSNPAVPQELLHNANVHSIAQRQCCYCMPQHMRCRVAVDPCFPSQLCDEF